LAPDHLVKDYRDPIKCDCCDRSGHKSFQCKATLEPRISNHSSCARSSATPNLHLEAGTDVGRGELYPLRRTKTRRMTL
jgi:hypothetical protein